MKPSEKEIFEFWQERALDFDCAGTRDFCTSRLEEDAFSSLIRKGSSVLEVGCGSGDNLLRLARERNCQVSGIDFSPAMIELAKNRAAKAQIDVKLRVESLQQVGFSESTFDYVITKRCLINVPSLRDQVYFMNNVSRRLKPDGILILCECTAQGLRRLNVWRNRFLLPTISSPWHNSYLDEEFLISAKFDGLKFKRQVQFSSTYYFLSRVLYAWWCLRRGIEPRYGSWVNKVSIRLPSFGAVGQSSLFIWQKTEL